VIIPTRDGDRSITIAARPADTFGAWKSGPTWSHSGQTVTPEGAMALTAVYGGVMLIAQTCGTMQLEVIDESKPVGDRLVRNARIATILGHTPNRDMSAVSVWMMIFVHLLLRGNGYLAKLRDASGYVNELIPLLPTDVTPWRAPDGRKLFRVRLLSGSEWFEYDFTEDAILHIPGPSLDDPLVGVSPFTLVRHRIGAHLAQSEYQGRSYRDGLLIKGVLSTPQNTITPETAQRMQERWAAAYGGMDGAGKVPVLHSGITFQPVSLSPEDAQFIQTMKWGHTEVATILQLPASRLNGDTGNSNRYANMAQDDLFAHKSAMLPRLEMVEAALRRDPDLFGPGARWTPRFNADAALRADVLTRRQTQRIERELGMRSINEQRADEGWSNIGPEGDDYTPLKNSTTNAPAAAAQGDQNAG
jgi:HK97 family phage portal protein